MSPWRSFLSPPPGVDLSSLSGMLLVIEGPDASGRSTHINGLTNWLEETGFSVARTGLRRSTLVRRELDKAKGGNVLSPRTLSLFYATDFYDQLENVVVPALRGGLIVLADRYIFTLMARDLVRGSNPSWVESLYSRAIVANAVFYLQVEPEELALRTLRARGRLDYWESGMDLGLSRDWYDCFMEYQRRIDETFQRLRERYNFEVIDANRPAELIQLELRARVMRHLESQLPSSPLASKPV